VLPVVPTQAPVVRHLPNNGIGGSNGSTGNNGIMDPEFGRPYTTTPERRLKSLFKHKKFTSNETKP